MQKRDLDVAAQLFEVASDGANEDYWTHRFQEHIAQAMRKHSNYIRNSGVAGGVEHQLEVLRARLELHEVVCDRLESRASIVDPGLGEAFGMLRDANRPIIQDVFELQGAPGARLPRGSSPAASAGFGSNGTMRQSPRFRRSASGVNSSFLPGGSPGDGGGVSAFASAATSRRRAGDSYGNTPEATRFSAGVMSPGHSVLTEMLESPRSVAWTPSGVVHEQTLGQSSSGQFLHGPSGGGGGGGDGRRSPRGYGAIHGGQPTKDLASRPAKELTIRQIREIMSSVYSSKAQHDQRCREMKGPLETLEQHLYSFLSKRYGIKSVVHEWARAIFRTIQRFASREVDVLVFGKILQNNLSESFSTVQDTLRATVQMLLRSNLQQRQQQRAQSEIDALWRARARSGVPLPECEDVVRYMYNEKDCEVVLERLYALADAGTVGEERSQSGGGRQNNTSGPDIIRYRDLLQVLLTFQMQLTEGFLADFVTIFREIDTDHDGIIVGAQLEDLVYGLATVEESEVNKPEAMAALEEAASNALASMRPFLRATFSECVDLCTNLISARWAAIGEDSAVAGGASGTGASGDE